MNFEGILPTLILQPFVALGANWPELLFACWAAGSTCRASIFSLFLAAAQRMEAQPLSGAYRASTNPTPTHPPANDGRGQCHSGARRLDSKLKPVPDGPVVVERPCLARTGEFGVEMAENRRPHFAWSRKPLAGVRSWTECLET